MTASDPTQDPKFAACVDLVPRTGAKSFQIRFSDDPEPLVWITVGEWQDKGGNTVHEVAAALDPTDAVFRLLERAIDGGTCAHCAKPTGITWEFARALPMSKQICWWQWDPETKKFRRGCEGD